MFFPDSDDAIHPLLFEEMLRQIEEHHVEMVFCNFIQVENIRINAVLARASLQDRRPQWQTGEGPEAERWFHIGYSDALSRISGMVSRERIGSLRFDEALSVGEDGLFMYGRWAFRFLFRAPPALWERTYPFPAR